MQIHNDHVNKGIIHKAFYIPSPQSISTLLLINSFIHMRYIVWAISLPCTPSPPSPSTPFTSRQNLFCPLLQFCWKEDISNNKKDIALLLVWDKESYTERFLALVSCTSVLQPKLIHLYHTSSPLPWSPSYSDLCHFKITILAPLQWTHQTLSSLGFSTYAYSSFMCPPLSVWPMSNNITAFVLGLKFTYEGEHKTFGFLSLTNFT
jgi:hypothetical protein